MIDKKDTFIIRKKYRNQIQNLTGNQRRELLDCIFSYQLEGKYESNDGAVCMLMDIMIDEWKDDYERYLEVCEKNRENGKKGGAKKGNQNARKDWKNNQNNRTVEKQPKQADSDNDIKENSISKDILKEKQTLYSSYYGKSKGVDEKVCNKLIDDKLKQGITLDTIKKCMVLYNCECRIKQDFKYVKKLETWLKEFQPPNDEQLDERLYSVIKSFRDKKKSDDKFGQSSPAKTLWNDLKTTFGDDKVKSLWKQANSINLTFT